MAKLTEEQQTTLAKIISEATTHATKKLDFKNLRDDRFETKEVTYGINEDYQEDTITVETKTKEDIPTSISEAGRFVDYLVQYKTKALEELGINLLNIGIYEIDNENNKHVNFQSENTKNLIETFNKAADQLYTIDSIKQGGHDEKKEKKEIRLENWRDDVIKSNKAEADLSNYNNNNDKLNLDGKINKTSRVEGIGVTAALVNYLTEALCRIFNIELPTKNLDMQLSDVIQTFKEHDVQAEEKNTEVKTPTQQGQQKDGPSRGRK